MADAFLLGVCVIFALAKIAPPVSAATLPIASIAPGKVVSINGQQFVKIGTDPVKGSRFMAVTPACQSDYVWAGNACRSVAANGANGMNMQDFTSEYCSGFATPAATGYTLVGTLKDSRDGKTYEVRKFADGKCWMVDNLMYGGATDNCAGVDVAGYTSATYGGANGMAAYSNRFGANTYGNCRDPRVGGAAPCTAGSTACGYLYNWQAAMQHPSAYYNTTYTGPTSNVQGLCPTGWHLSVGNNTGEFATLDRANGGTGATQTSCTSASCNFWRPGYSYKGVYSGLSDSSGSLFFQGSYLYLWSASEGSVIFVWYLGVDSSVVDPGSYNGLKDYGFAVRCIKN